MYTGYAAGGEDSYNIFADTRISEIKVKSDRQKEQVAMQEGIWPPLEEKRREERMTTQWPLKQQKP
jgi:hypothetical protein